MTGFDQSHVTSGGAWLARVRNPESAHEYRTLIPSRRLRTERWAAAQAAVAAARDSVRLSPEFWAGADLYELAYLPELLHRERAITWAALREVGCVSPDLGWRPTPDACGARSWRSRDDLKVVRNALRAQVIGFGESLPQVMTAADTPHGVDIEAYRDGFDQVNWQQLGTDVHKAAMSTLIRTPYGLLWVDNG